MQAQQAASHAVEIESSSDEGEDKDKQTEPRDFTKLFFLPENEAAEKLNMSKSKLKRLKKKKNIQRWPYRRLQSIQRKIESNKEVLLKANGSKEADSINAQNQDLQSTINFIVAWPNSISKFTNDDILEVVKKRRRVSIPNLLNPVNFDDRSTDDENDEDQS
ncbi:hypothetical protein AKO1_008140 [Acrasis kona]|uniref:RWP-RK domain-containing protein n=1 Tax=Acrasis kona TaxID=1008807 RepID=A0AAW2YN03_9EUKA